MLYFILTKQCSTVYKIDYSGVMEKPDALPNRKPLELQRLVECSHLRRRRSHPEIDGPSLPLCRHSAPNSPDFPEARLWPTSGLPATRRRITTHRTSGRKTSKRGSDWGPNPVTQRRITVPTPAAERLFDA